MTKENIIEKLKITLPTTPGIMGREEYLNSAVLVPLMLIKGDYHLVFQKRASAISQPSEICFPGGRFDESLDSVPEDTAIRETVEELGVGAGKISIIGRLHTLVTPRGVIVDPFIGKIALNSPNDFSPDAREVEEVFTIPILWFLENRPEIYSNRVVVQSSYRDTDGKEHILLPVEKLGLPKHYTGSRTGWNFRVFVYKTDPYVIWGLTAKILFNLIEILKKNNPL